eukprot:CAMPEP_0178749982 /NCGR_PEP_ID=MMETSP0744-20121128/9700_1 /TAXON_ID=913974 /ORGANISM="Nitzschia punctata, Strain CCMP561" /LENGTH=140 /DNA_ID=CAMNT_0020403431 /DNA_START=1 /DNA_END=424 /DNA_ORIENTATION=-
MINSRNKHMDHEKELERDLHTLCYQTSHLLSHSSSRGEDGFPGRRRLCRPHSSTIDEAFDPHESILVNWNSERTIDIDPAENDHIQDLEHEESPKIKKVKVWGEQFFEHFLDGSAGVMYTSFFGLILDKFIRYGEKNKDY